MGQNTSRVLKGGFVAIVIGEGDLDRAIVEPAWPSPVTSSISSQPAHVKKTIDGL